MPDALYSCHTMLFIHYTSGSNLIVCFTIVLNFATKKMNKSVFTFSLCVAEIGHSKTACLKLIDILRY